MKKEKQTILDTIAESISDGISMRIWDIVQDSRPPFITLDPKQTSRELYARVIESLHKDLQKEKVEWAKEEGIPPDGWKTHSVPPPMTKAGALMFARYKGDTETQVRVLLVDGTYDTPIHIASSAFDTIDEQWHPEVIEHIKKIRRLE